MAQLPSWEANRSSASHQTPPILWNQTVHYCVRRACPLSLALVRSIQSMPPYHFLKINFNIILPSMPGSSNWSLSLRFPHQNPVCTSPCPSKYYTPHPSHSFWFHHLNNICWGVQIKELLIIQSSPLFSFLIPLTHKPLPQYSIPERPQPMFVPQCDWPRCTPVQNNG